MEEVWEKEDELVGEEFNPKTFFKLHGKKISYIAFTLKSYTKLFFLDTNDDGFWDEFEIEALFQLEVG